MDIFSVLRRERRGRNTRETTIKIFIALEFSSKERNTAYPHGRQKTFMMCLFSFKYFYVFAWLLHRRALDEVKMEVIAEYLKSAFLVVWHDLACCLFTLAVSTPVGRTASSNKKFAQMPKQRRITRNLSYFPLRPYQRSGPRDGSFLVRLLIILCVRTAQHTFMTSPLRASSMPAWNMTKGRRNYYHYRSLASPQKRVHQRFQIIRNIYVAQINSRAKRECRRYL